MRSVRRALVVRAHLARMQQPVSALIGFLPPTSSAPRIAGEPFSAARHAAAKAGYLSSPHGMRKNQLLTCADESPYQFSGFEGSWFLFRNFS